MPAADFTLRPGAQVQLDLVLLSNGWHEIAALLASSSVQIFGGALLRFSLMVSGDFARS
ncbi:MAG: hypothetical protein ABIL01_25995 [Pseudomonadota bacterium]